MKKPGLKREEIFLETKLWPSFYEQADAVEKTLERLDTDYIDLLLIHQPAGNYMAGYRLMAKAYKEGKVKAIGLSNFTVEQIQEILAACEVKPAVLQTEVHSYSQEKELKAFWDQEGIVSANTEPDKLEKSGFHPVKSQFVDAPLIEELPVTLECRFLKENEDGNIIGQIVNVSADESVLEPDGSIDFTKFRPISFEPAHNACHVLGEKAGNVTLNNGVQMPKPGYGVSQVSNE